jgi:hypothetical protein
VLIKETSIKELRQIPGVGKTIANDLWNIGFKAVTDLQGHDPQIIYDLQNRFKGSVQDRCMLYVFRCAVYYADTDKSKHDTEKLKWWNWKDK